MHMVQCRSIYIRLHVYRSSTYLVSKHRGSSVTAANILPKTNHAERLVVDVHSHGGRTLVSVAKPAWSSMYIVSYMHAVAICTAKQTDSRTHHEVK